MTNIYHIGIDLHAQTAAIAWPSSCGKLEYHGTCSATVKSTGRTLCKLAASSHVPITVLRACYEAGPTGSVLDRCLVGLGL